MVMQVNQALCAGCGVCEEVCPTGAIHLVDQMAEINKALCTQCEACVDACPNGAIITILEPTQLTPTVALTATEIQTMPAPTRAALWEAEPSRRGLASLAGAALAFLGREVAPRLVDVLATALERQLTTSATSAKASLSTSPRSPAKTSRGIRRQARYRGGRTNNRNRKERR